MSLHLSRSFRHLAIETVSTTLSFFGLAVVAMIAMVDRVDAQTPASIKVLSTRTVTMPKIADCKTLDVCELKSAKLIEQKLKVLLADERADYASYMTDMRLVLSFSSPDDVPKFGAVQFLRGCMYESELKTDGHEEKAFRYVHKLFGAYALLRHDNWVIDSSHADPLTSSFENHGRFDLYKWNQNPQNTDANDATWYFNAKPPHGTVFKADLIANSGLIEDPASERARNSSLELETCVFKITDLPKTTDIGGTGVDKSKALWCASWDHKFRYDFSTRQVQPEKSINAFCSQPSNW